MPLKFSQNIIENVNPDQVCYRIQDFRTVGRYCEWLWSEYFKVMNLKFLHNLSIGKAFDPNWRMYVPSAHIMNPPSTCSFRISLSLSMYFFRAMSSFVSNSSWHWMCSPLGASVPSMRFSTSSAGLLNFSCFALNETLQISACQKSPNIVKHMNANADNCK